MPNKSLDKSQNQPQSTRRADSANSLSSSDSTIKGLTTAKVLASRAKYGPNELQPMRKLNLFQKALHVLTEPMFLLLLATASIYFILGEITDGFIMLGCVLFVSGIEFFQERKTDKALEELNTLSAINIHVIRDGRAQVIDSKDLVVGDIVLLEEGDKIPADGKILAAQGLGVNESALTGESAVVYKKPVNSSNNSSNSENFDNANTSAEPSNDFNEHFKPNMCYAGCDVTNGSATIEITAVGPETEYGKIGKALSSIKKTKTPLEKQIQKLIIICTIISLTFCIIITLVNFFYNAHLDLKDRLIQSILSGITMAMATIPEEIPVVLTVFLAMGAWKLAKQNALTRNMKAVETLGAVTVLCTDKTGTITENKMTVKDIFTTNPNFATIAALACPKTPYDPMEIAIQKYAFAHGVDQNVYNQELIHEYVFNNEDKMMGQVWENHGAKTLYVKGAYESILPLCGLEKSTIDQITSQVKTFSHLGYRVLAVAERQELNEIPERLSDNPLTFVGLITLVDPPRQGIKASVEACHNAGIRIIMITGDNGQTAEGIASQIGLRNSSEIITGAELEQMSDQELQNRVKTTNIFARVYPNHKMRIVKALQHNHEVVAMTGDGVNDAPALKKAEIGIAMGERGTNVAKEASDLILLDDNFNTIVDAISNGRTIYANIKKAISYILVIHIPIILTALFVPLFDLPLLLLPVHIVLLELIIDPTSSIIFQRLKPDQNVMHEKPRRLNASLIDFPTVIKCLTQGALIFLAIFLSYSYLIRAGRPQAEAAAFSFTTLVLANIFVVYVLQSDRPALYNLIIDLKDKIIVLINTAIIIVLLLIIYVPLLNRLVGTTPLSLSELLAALGLAALATLIFDLVKLFKH